MTTIQIHRGTAAQWTSANPVLATGEIGFEKDTNKFKFGDGIRTWASLPYFISVDDLSSYINSVIGTAGRAVSTDGSFGLPAPTGIGFEWIITGNVLDDVQMNGTSL